MQRRQFIALLGSAAAAWPLVARAQQLAGEGPRIGFLQRIRNENVVAFIQGLRDAGYADGQNAVIETRFYETTLDRLPDLAKELVDTKCNVIVAGSQYAFEAVMRATSTTPIVGIDLESDPVARGWAKSLGHPGRKFTGFLLDPSRTQRQTDRTPQRSRADAIPSGSASESYIGNFNFLPPRLPRVRQE